MTTTLDILRSTRKLLTDPDHWTQGAAARDKDDCELGGNHAIKGLGAVAAECEPECDDPACPYTH